MFLSWISGFPHVELLCQGAVLPPEPQSLRAPPGPRTTQPGLPGSLQAPWEGRGRSPHSILARNRMRWGGVRARSQAVTHPPSPAPGSI